MKLQQAAQASIVDAVVLAGVPQNLWRRSREDAQGCVEGEAALPVSIHPCAFALGAML